MWKISGNFSSIRLFLLLFCACCAIFTSIDGAAAASEGGYGALVKREERTTLVSTEYGEISAARVTDSINGSYLLHSFTLDPNSLFLPVILHADMVFYVHTGSGKLSWMEENDLKSSDLRRGDAYRLQEGAVFFIQSNLDTEAERQKLRIHAIFANSKKNLHEPATEPYSSIRDMVLGFDKKVLQAAFMVPEEKIEELLNGTKPPAIVHGVSRTKRKTLETEAQFIGRLLGSRTYNIFELNKKKKKAGATLFNLFKEDKDFENCNGWSTTVTRKKLPALKGTNIGLFMVNLTTGSMMGPHWNPIATEIAVVLQGRGMVRVVCSSVSNEIGCRNTRYEVEEGDIFVVPKFHAMAQMSFNNETLVFMGFSTSAKRNHPQFLAGQASVFQTLDKDVLAISFNVTNTTMDQLLASQHDSIILGCVSCAEEELRIIEEEIEKEREAAREREEEERRREEEERRREEEEARKREKEEGRRQEEERKRREEEEAARKREEEEERKRQEEEAAKREEEERKRREEEEEKAARRREEEEEEERKRQKEEATKREEEEEEEEAARREEEERQREEEEEQEARRREEEERQREEEEEREARRREEEEARQREQQQQQGEREARRREEEEARQREQQQQQEEAREREEKEETRQRRQQQEQEEEEARRRQQEQEEARHKQEEEEAQREQQEHEAAARRREEEEQEERQRRRSEEEQAAEEERRRQQETEREEEAARRHGGEWEK